MRLDVFFLFKQKTAYEMRISDWSSDVCSSDLPPTLDVQRGHRAMIRAVSVMIGRIAKSSLARPAARPKSRPCRSLFPLTAASKVPSWLGVPAAALASASPVPGFSTSVATLSGARADRTRVGEGKGGSDRGAHGGRRTLKQ